MTALHGLSRAIIQIYSRKNGGKKVSKEIKGFANIGAVVEYVSNVLFSQGLF